MITYTNQWGTVVHVNRVYTRRPAIDRFLEKIDYATNGCWLWTASLVNGYAHFHDEQHRSVLGHIFAYRYFKGIKLTKELELHHKCETPRCVNPEHLEPLTRKEHSHKNKEEHWVLKQMAQTHCRRGHPLEGINLKLRKRGNSMMRMCRECIRIRQRKYRNSEKGKIVHAKCPR